MTSTKQIKPIADLQIASITGPGGYPVRYWTEDCGEGLWLYRDASGIMGVVQARTWETAYECVLDEILHPIELSEVPEAYGCESQEELDRLVAQAEETGDYPELIDGYEYQPNASGTGIVPVDYNEFLEPLTPELLKDLGLQLRLERW